MSSKLDIHVNERLETKINDLGSFIQELKSRVGTQLPKEAVVTFTIMLFTNIQDLYTMQRETYNAIRILQDEISRLSHTRGDKELKHQVSELTERFNNTFGPLEERLNKANEYDAENLRKLREGSFYA